MAEYINRDTFIKLLKETKNDCTRYADKACCDLAIQMVNLMPIADVQEVRHGKWVYISSNLKRAHCECSECGYTVLFPNDVDCFYNY